MHEQAKLQQVPVKVYRTENRLMVAAPMPGMEPEDIMVEITEDGRLIITGEVRGLLKDVKELLLDEWSVGVFYRELVLPDAVDGPQATITYGNGVIVAALPITTRIIPTRLTLEHIGSARGVSSNEV